jgi:hypothetical protein
MSWVLQGDYGYGHGYEDLSAGTLGEMQAEAQTYRREAPEGRYRVVPDTGPEMSKESK